jgi:hypothetical protein
MTLSVTDSGSSCECQVRMDVLDSGLLKGEAPLYILNVLIDHFVYLKDEVETVKRLSPGSWTQE